MQILFLSRWFPYPANNGAKLRILNLLRGLSTSHKIILVCFTDHPGLEIPPELSTLCEKVRAVGWKEFQPNSRRALLGVFGRTPRSLVDTYSIEMEKEIRNVIGIDTIDLIICSELIMTAYRHLFGNIPVLFEEIEIGLLYAGVFQSASLKQRFRNWLTWKKQTAYLSSLLNDHQVCTVVSEQEKQLLQRVVSQNTEIHVFPNCVKLDEYGDIREERVRNSLVFTGSFRYQPNYEAMIWFLDRVYPLVQSQVPDVSLTITGDHMDLALPARTNVTCTGFVDDVRPYIARASASVVPLLSGGGTRLKILEAMALGTPVVSTSKGAEGLDVEDNRHLVIADRAEDFASQVVKVINDSELRCHLSDNGYRLVQAKYDWDGILPGFIRLVEYVAYSRNQSLIGN